MFGKAQLASRRREGRVAIALLVVLVASLIAYKTGPALRAIQTAHSRLRAQGLTHEIGTGLELAS
jgi:hypothetical protein